GRFLYRAGEARGRALPASGYRHDVTHAVGAVAGLDRLFAPILEGVPARFSLTDELYLCPVFEADVTPLLRSDFTFSDEHFYSATRALEGEMNSREGWTHPRGSDLVAWVKRARRSPVVYVQFGDAPHTYQNAHYRRLVRNALGWAASEAALMWARSG
ncbi:MAG: ThuA domain-containing protein, partial [Caulobacterales bacterium]|nr:ThuA domain-containing protein [Caulobacterales bacterium]